MISVLCRQLNVCGHGESFKRVSIEYRVSNTRFICGQFGLFYSKMNQWVMLVRFCHYATTVDRGRCLENTTKRVQSLHIASKTDKEGILSSKKSIQMV